MTTLEALVSVSHTLLKANGRWVVYGIDATLRRDIDATVHDVARLFRTDCNVDQLISMAINELERLAASECEEPPQPIDDGSCDPLYGQRTANVRPTYGQRTANVRPTYGQRMANVWTASTWGSAERGL